MKTTWYGTVYRNHRRSWMPRAGTATTTTAPPVSAAWRWVSGNAKSVRYSRFAPGPETDRA